MQSQFQNYLYMKNYTPDMQTLTHTEGVSSIGVFPMHYMHYTDYSQYVD
jgi:hypothetical protein